MQLMQLTAGIWHDLPLLLDWCTVAPDDSDDTNVGKHACQSRPFDHLLLLEAESIWLVRNLN